MVAAFFGTGQPQAFAQRIQQRGARIKLKGPVLAIHAEAERHQVGRFRCHRPHMMTAAHGKRATAASRRQIAAISPFAWESASALAKPG
jgi:hypothetical protein